jgi:SAM-dependent methyltransferase
LDKYLNFWTARSKKPKFLWANLLPYNFEIIQPFIKPEHMVLDLGAGDGQLSHKISECVKSVDVDSGTRQRRENLHWHNYNVKDFNTVKKFDLVLIFGVMNFIEDRAQLLKKAAGFLNPHGVIIVKHQCGLEAELRVDSDIDGDRYHAIYPYIDDEISRFKSIFQVIDVGRAYNFKNKHDNTDFYKFIGMLK